MVVTKGELKLTCPRVELTLDGAHNVTRAHASGGVVAELRGGHVDADTADLDVAKQVLEVRGGVRVSRGGAHLSADSARLELATSKIALSQVSGTLPATASVHAAATPPTNTTTTRP